MSRTADAGAPPHLSSPPSAADFLTSLLRTSVCGSIQQTTSISSQSIQDVSWNSSQRWCCLRKVSLASEVHNTKGWYLSSKVMHPGFIMVVTEDKSWEKCLLFLCFSLSSSALGSAVNLHKSFFCIKTNLGPFGCLFFFFPPWNKWKHDEKTLVVFLLLWTEADQ